MRIAFAGYAGRVLLGIVLPLAWNLAIAVSLPSRHDIIYILPRLDFVLETILSLLFVMGLAMTFRDVRRRLTSYENAS
jgi:hypothetical protein